MANHCLGQLKISKFLNNLGHNSIFLLHLPSQDTHWVSVSWSQRRLKYKDYTSSQVKSPHILKEPWWLVAFQINWQHWMILNPDNHKPCDTLQTNSCKTSKLPSWDFLHSYTLWAGGMWLNKPTNQPNQPTKPHTALIRCEWNLFLKCYAFFRDVVKCLGFFVFFFSSSGTKKSYFGTTLRMSWIIFVPVMIDRPGMPALTAQGTQHWGLIYSTYS